jgi:hypothetical protein
MAQKVITVVTDDLDGTEIANGQGDTVTFGLDGVTYELDLTNANAQALRDAIAPYIKVGRKSGSSTSASKSTGGGRRKNSGSSASRSDTQTIREWAKANNLEVSERGRISGALRAQFSAAQN